MEIQVERDSGSLILRISGDLRLWNHPVREEELLRKVPEGLEAPAQHVVLVLRGLTHIDSKGITALVRIVILCTKQNLGFAVVLPTGLPGDALRRIRIFDSWPQFEDEAAALKAIGSSSNQRRQAS